MSRAGLGAAGAVRDTSGRFRPSRAGLRNVWEYDDAVFHFAGGRMIFRGPNGSGKSNALALLFPFVLDGRAGATYMDPHGGGRNLKSLLLCQRRGDAGRRYEFDSRVGYAWLELRRDTADGPRWVTIGVGARASVARDADTWFFVTDRRVGIDLDLAPDGVPLTRGGLAVALGDRLPPPVSADAPATHAAGGPAAPVPAVPAAPAGSEDDEDDPDDDGDDADEDGLDGPPDGPAARRGRRRVSSPCVLHTIEEYQAAIDRALFGTGVERLRKLVSLVLVLRRPHLAARLDLDGLSASLSEALTPVSDELIETVAAAFEDLDRIRARLRELRAAVAAVRGALPWYSGYLRTEARARALALVAAEREATAAARRHAQAGRELAATEAAVLELEQALEAARIERRQATGQLRGLETSEEYRAVLALDDLVALVEERHRALGAAREALDEAAGDADRAAGEHQAAAAEVEEAGGRLAGQARLLAAAAAGAGVGPETVAGLTDPDRLDLGALEPAELRRRLDTAERERAAELRRVRAAMERARQAELALALAREAEADADEAMMAALAARDDGQAQVEAARTALTAEVAAWVAAVAADQATSHVPPGADLSEAVAALGADSAPLARAAAGLLVADREDAAGRLHAARERRDDLDGQARTLRAERARVAAETDPGPPPAATRPADRAGRPGAPLYACCDFAGHLDAAGRAGVEAALEAAGLLDAWVTPDGLAEPDTLDAFLVPAAAPSGQRLSAVLVADPPPGSGLGAAAVARVLDALALGDGDGVGTDGRYRLGMLAGRWAKDRAEYIGAAARAERRRCELERIDGELERLAAELASAAQAESAAISRLAALDGLVARLPGTGPLAAALRDLDQATGALRAAEAVLGQAGETARRQLGRLVQAEAERDATARQAGVTAVAERLEAVEQRLDEFRAAARDAVDALRAERAAVAERERALERLAAAERRRAGREHAAQLAQEALAGDGARLEAIRQALAEAPEQIRERVALARDRLAGAEEHADRTDERLGEAREARGQARAAAVAAEAARELAARRRDEVAAQAAPLAWAVVREAVGGHAATADGTPLGPLATMIAGATADVATDEAALAAARKGILDAHKRLREELAGGYDPNLRPEHDLYLLEIVTDDGTLTLFEAAEQLAEAERTQAQRLSGSEEETFERHLFTSVVQEIQTRMNETRSFEAGINASLAGTPTSSGLTVRLRWTVDADDPAVAQAVELLRQDPEQLDRARRDRLRRFFGSRIEQARAEHPGATYTMILPGVLDYRAWHRFVLTLVDATGATTRLTPQVFKTLSGGEAAAAVHLPLLAAVDAYLAGADPHAPRIVALDEAFAGIDTHLRGPLLGLLVDFDLDWVIASHELWGNYPQVPACQIYSMRRRPPVLGVHTQPTRWDGRRLLAGVEG